MAVIFSSASDGVVTAVVVGRATPSTLKIPNLRGISGRDIVVTNVEVSQDVAAQFMKSLRSALYIYSFGDNIGRLRISGIAFHKRCSGSEEFAGVTQLLQFYRSNSIAEKIAPLKVSFGSFTLEAFLIGHKITTLSSEHVLTQFNMDLAVPPTQIKG